MSPQVYFPRAVLVCVFQGEQKLNAIVVAGRIVKIIIVAVVMAPREFQELKKLMWLAESSRYYFVKLGRTFPSRMLILLRSAIASKLSFQWLTTLPVYCFAP